MGSILGSVASAGVEEVARSRAADEGSPQGENPTMTVVARFRVASRATGIRRQVWVRVYDDIEELKRSNAKAREIDYDPEADIGGSVVIEQGFPWPKPDPGPAVVMRLWTGQLTTRTIAHESVHAAAAFYFMDVTPGWNSRSRAMLLGNHEPLAYLVGDFSAEIIRVLYKIGLLPG